MHSTERKRKNAPICRTQNFGKTDLFAGYLCRQLYSEHSSEIKHYFFKWFAVNLMKNHVDKCYLLVNASNKVNIRINNINICNEKCKNLFGCKFLPQTYIWSPYFWIMQIYELQRGWALIWIYKRGVCLWTWFLLHQNLVVALSNRCFAVVLTNGIQKSSLNVTWELLIRKSSYRLKSY